MGEGRKKEKKRDARRRVTPALPWDLRQIRTRHRRRLDHAAMHLRGKGGWWRKGVSLGRGVFVSPARGGDGSISGFSSSAFLLLFSRVWNEKGNAVFLAEESPVFFFFFLIPHTHPHRPRLPLSPLWEKRVPAQWREYQEGWYPHVVYSHSPIESR